MKRIPEPGVKKRRKKKNIWNWTKICSKRRKWGLYIYRVVVKKVCELIFNSTETGPGHGGVGDRTCNAFLCLAGLGFALVALTHAETRMVFYFLLLDRELNLFF